MTTTCLCGEPYEPGEKFCGACGMHLPGWVVCPYCDEQTELSNFCGECGRSLKSMFSSPDVQEGIWERGLEDFAVNLAEDDIKYALDGNLVIRPGTRALLFENGNLVQEVTSGRHSTQEGGLISKLFKAHRQLSVMLVDDGNVELDFRFAELKTKDGLFADLALDAVLQMNDPTAFFVNVIKEKRAFKTFELRRLLYAPMQEILKETCQNYSYEELTGAAQIRQQIRARLEAGLRGTLRRSGLEIADVTTLTVGQEKLDALDRQAADDRIKAKEIAGQAQGRQTIGGAEADARKGDRDLARRNLEEDVADHGLEMDAKAFDNRRRQVVGDKEIEGQLIDVDHYRKRVDVLKAIKAADVEKIKTEEDFRKFKLEVDREQVLDASEWKAFKDEILWKDEDRKRDRAFLVAKVELQQKHDIEMISLSNRADLTLEQKRREAEILDFDLEKKLDREMRRVDGEAKVRLAEAELRSKEQQIEMLTQSQAAAEKQRIEIQLAKEKAVAKAEVAKLEIEEKRLKAELGMANLERMKLIKAAELDRDQIRELERRKALLDEELRREESAHTRQMESRRFEQEAQMERYGAMAAMSTEQLIAVSPEKQGELLNDLAKSSIMKDMDSEQIIAMKDPLAMARALEERAKNTQSEELKVLYERMLAEANASADKVAQAYRDSADRAERMFDRGLSGAASQNEQVLSAERKNAATAERMAGQAMDRMGDVAGTARQSSEADGGSDSAVYLCPNCKQRVPADTNFCKNCGTKMY